MLAGLSTKIFSPSTKNGGALEKDVPGGVMNFLNFTFSTKSRPVAPELPELQYMQEEETEPEEEGVSLEEIENIRLLFDYLSINGDKCANDKDKLTAFGKLVTKCLEDLPADNKLADVLQEHGWSGLKFLHIIAIDFNALQKSLGTLYMNARQQRAKANRQRALEESASSNQLLMSKVGSPNTGLNSGGINGMGSPSMKNTSVSFKNMVFSGDAPSAFAVNAAHEEDGTAQQGIASFCPDSLINTVLNTTMMKFLPNEMLEPMSQKFFGVSLLADISGFTKLSSGFCLRGSAGLDDLHGVTSGFLGRLVRIVYWFNGDVIAFAGDALVCVFVEPSSTRLDDDHLTLNGDEQGPSLYRAASRDVDAAGVRAEMSLGNKNRLDGSMSKDDKEASVSFTAAAGRMSSNGSSYKTDNAPYFLKGLYAALCLVCCDTNDLTAHAALSAGEMGIATLGGTNDEWTYLLNGPCIAELCCIDDAKSKEVVITPVLYNMLRTLDVLGNNSTVRNIASITEGNTLDVEGSAASKLSHCGAGGVGGGSTTSVDANNGVRSANLTLGGELKTDDDKILSAVLCATEGVPSGASKGGSPVGSASGYGGGGYGGGGGPAVMSMSAIPSAAQSGAVTPTRGSEYSGSPDKRSNGPHWDRIDFEQSNITCLPSGNYLIKSLHVSAAVDHAHRSNKYGGNAKFVMPNKCNAPAQLRMIDRVPAPAMLAKRYDKYEDTLDVTENVGKLTPFVPLTMTSDDDGSPIPTIHVTPELREVTTVFVNLNSYDKVANADPLSLQPFFLLCQEALLEVDGFLRQFLVDDKGCVLIAMWGVPSFTYPNNGSRAVYFARKLKTTTNAAKMKVSIGITTGNVYCGTIGSIIRRDYVAIGHTVNMSARLMGKAKGRILVDSTTYQLLPLASREELTQGEELQLKGTTGVTRPWVAEYSGFDLTSGFDLEGEDVNGDEPLVKTSVAKALKIALDNMQSVEAMNNLRPVLNAESAVSRVHLSRIGSGEVSLTAAKMRNLSFRGGLQDMAVSPSNGNSNSFNPTAFLLNANMSGGGGYAGGGATKSYVHNIANTSSYNPGGSVMSGGSAMNMGISAVNASATFGGGDGGPGPRRRLSMRPARAVDDAASKIIQRTGSATGEQGKVKFIVVNGGSGMGKSNVAKYFRHGAKRRLLRYLYIQLHLGDENTPLKLIKMIIVQLIGEPFFIGEDKQINVIQYLLKSSFPDIDADDLHYLLTNISEAMDLKWQEDSITRLIEVSANKDRKSRKADRTKIGANTYVKPIEEKPNSRKLSLFGAGIGSANASANADNSGASSKLTKNRNQSMFGSGGLMGLLRGGSISDASAGGGNGLIAPPGSTRGGGDFPGGGGGAVNDVAGAMAAALKLAESADYSPPRATYDNSNSRKSGPAASKTRTGSVFAPIGSFFFGNKGADDSTDQDENFDQPSVSVSVTASTRRNMRSGSMLATVTGTQMRSAYSILTPVATMQQVLVTLLAQKKTVLIIDDAHHADEQSLKELYALFGKPLGLTVLLTENQSNVTPMMPSGGSERRISGTQGMSQRRGTRMTMFSDESASAGVAATPGSGNAPGIAAVSPGGVVSPGGMASPGSLTGGVGQFSAQRMAGAGMSTRGNNGGGVNKFTQIKAHPECQTVTLTSLDISEINALLVSQFKDSTTSLPDTLAQTVLDASSGNPFWCNTIAHHIRDKGIENFSETVGDATAEGAKNPLAGLILCRLDSLPSGAQLLLKNACVIGEQVSRAELESVSPLSVLAHMDDYLQLLVTNGFIYNLDDDYYAFYNQIIRKAITEIIPPSESYAVHEGVAKFIEQNNTAESDLRPFYVALSYHYSLSGPSRVKETFYYTIKAAEYAIECSSMSTATSFIQQALLILQQNAPIAGGSVSPVASSGSSRPAAPVFTPNAYAENIIGIMDVIDAGLKILNPGGVLTQAVRMVRSSVSGDFTKAQLTQTFFSIKDTAETLLKNHNAARGVSHQDINRSVRKSMVKGLSRGLNTATLNITSTKERRSSKKAALAELSIDQNLDIAAKNAAKSAKNLNKPELTPPVSKVEESIPENSEHSGTNENSRRQQQGYRSEEPSVSGASLRKKNSETVLKESEESNKTSGCIIM